MGSSSVLVSLALLAAAASAVADDVIVGTGDNFDKIIKDNPFVVAEFYAPWCGHCKNLEPEYSKAATELKKGDVSITLVKITNTQDRSAVIPYEVYTVQGVSIMYTVCAQQVDATEESNKAIATKYQVQGFPTLKIFRNGDSEKPQDYNGPRDAAGIVSYLQKKAGPASKLLTSKAEVEALREKDPAILGIFKNEKASEFATFSKVADQLSDDFDFGHIFDSDLAEEVFKAPSVVIYKDTEAKTLKYNGKFKVKDLEAWVESNALPLLPELDQSPKNKKALNDAFQSSKPKLFGFIAKADAQYDKFVQQLTAAAEGKVGEVFFILVDPPSNSHALNFFGLKEADTPAFVLQNENDKYIAKKALPKHLTKFIKDYEAGKLEKTVKSEDPPEDNSGPVTVVTANTFDEIVLSGKDVLIEFYAPWCGHCKKLTPIYEKVGEAFADNDTVVVAKMDATANDVPNSKFDVRGFPTIFFVSGKDGSVLEYSGDRSEDDLTAYIRSHASQAATADDHSEL